MVARPMLFSGDMVRAVLAGRKTQTRRLSFRGAVGDQLWVRETWAEPDAFDVVYRADREYAVTWRPSIFMPRWASRLTLEVTALRAEPLHAISVDDLLAEGVQIPVRELDADERTEVNRKVQPLLCLAGKFPPYEYSAQHPRDWDEAEWLRTHYASLWDTLNFKRAPWATNPTVQVITFKCVEGRHGRHKQGQ